MNISTDVILSASIALLVIERGWNILKALRNSRNEKSGEPVCPYHYDVVKDISAIKTDVKWVRKSIEDHRCVRGVDARD